jgi:hypothetical protein
MYYSLRIIAEAADSFALATEDYYFMRCEIKSKRLKEKF